MNKNVNVKHGLKLFVATVCPSLAYGLETAQLTSAHLQKIDVVQRKMLRKMIGWLCKQSDTWAECGH